MVPPRVLRLLSVETGARAGSSWGEPKKDVSWNIMSRGVTLFVPLRCVGASSVWGAAMNAIEQTRRVAELVQPEEGVLVEVSDPWNSLHMAQRSVELSSNVLIASKSASELDPRLRRMGECLRVFTTPQHNA